MAARTSQGSGNFTASATWGAEPADGDTFTIAAGHSVTSSTIDMPTNGYGDITIHGCLSFQSGSQFKLNGRATVYGGESNYFTEGTIYAGCSVNVGFQFSSRKRFVNFILSKQH